MKFIEKFRRKDCNDFFQPKFIKNNICLNCLKKYDYTNCRYCHKKITNSLFIVKYNYDKYYYCSNDCRDEGIPFL